MSLQWIFVTLDVLWKFFLLMWVFNSRKGQQWTTEEAQCGNTKKREINRWVMGRTALGLKKRKKTIKSIE